MSVKDLEIQTFCFMSIKDLLEIQTESPLAEALNTGGI